MKCSKFSWISQVTAKVIKVPFLVMTHLTIQRLPRSEEENVQSKVICFFAHRWNLATLCINSENQILVNLSQALSTSDQTPALHHLNARINLTAKTVTWSFWIKYFFKISVTPKYTTFPWRTYMWYKNQ